MDTIIDPGFLSRVIGKTIKISLTSGCFQGVLIHIDPGRTILISKVKDLGTGRTIPGTQLFFGHDILNVESQKESEDIFAEQETKGQVTSERENMPTEESAQPGGKHELETTRAFTSSPKEMRSSMLQAIKRAVDEEDVEYFVIDQFQPMFGPAIRHIRSQKVLSLAAAGLNICRYGKLCWLQVATRNRVYLFDILVLGPKVFKNGLQMVLEDRGILKVIHDCRWLADSLSHQYGVVLSNVFDTQVGDVYLFSMETGGFLPSHTSSLDECLRRHLNMSSSRLSFLKYRQKLLKENQKIWFDRPLFPALLKMLALEVTHLLPLRLAMLDAMMSDFTTLVDGYLNTLRQGVSDVLAGTEFPCSELPEELQQLTVLQKVRRERALMEYKVNSKGFLTQSKMLEQEEEEQGERRPEMFRVQMFMPNEAEPVVKLDDKEESQGPASGEESETYTVDKHEVRQQDIAPDRVSEHIQDWKPVAAFPFASPMGLNLRMSTPSLLAKFQSKVA